MTGQSKMEADAADWASDPTPMPEGWTRYDVPASTDPWQALPEEVEDRDFLPRVMIEYRESRIMGWGAAAIWVGPEHLR